MPELPEVETIRIGLERQIAGATIQNVTIADFPGVIEGMSIDQFRESVVNRSFTDLTRRGKYLLLGLDGELSIMVHLRMTGQLLVEPVTAPPTRFERVRIDLDDDRQLRFADQRKFGRVSLFTTQEVRALDRKLGIEPLSPGFTARRLQSMLSKRSGMIKALLLDQELIAGIGNIYADEALYRSRIHPATPASSLSSEEVRRLHGALRHVLRQSIDRNGTTFSSYRDSEGRIGENQFSLRVYGLGRKQHPCDRCGTILICLTVAGRSSHICPHCQPATG